MIPKKTFEKFDAAAIYDDSEYLTLKFLYSLKYDFSKI